VRVLVKRCTPCSLSRKDPVNDYFVLGGLTVCLYHKWILAIVHTVFYTTVGSPSRQSPGRLPKPAKGCCSAAMSEFWYGTGRRAAAVCDSSGDSHQPEQLQKRINKNQPRARSRLFLDAATVSGIRRRTIVTRNIIPNCLAPAGAQHHRGPGASGAGGRPWLMKRLLMKRY
jgi:hypothetical protein